LAGTTNENVAADERPSEASAYPATSQHAADFSLARTDANSELDAQGATFTPAETFTPSLEGSPLRVVWEGPQFVRASFALVNREMCSTLLSMSERERADGKAGAASRLELSVRAHGPFEFGAQEDPLRFAPLAAAFGAPLSGPPDVHVQMSYDFRTEPPPEGRWAVFQPWDYTSIPRRWLHLFETYVDEVWVPSRFVWRSFVGSGVSPSKVHVLPHGVRSEFFRTGLEPRELPTRKSFKFLFVGGTLWRKGIDILLDAYQRTFGPADDVTLVIKDVGAKSYYRPHNAEARIREMQRDVSAPEVVYLTDDVSDREVGCLYASCDCLVHPFRGEGFALPVAEAMGTGLPVIVTRGGPCDDYATDETAYFLPSRLVHAPMWEETVSPACVLEPDADALVELMRRVVRERDAARALGLRASRSIHESLTWERAARLALQRCDALARGASAPGELAAA
ncbi:MAG TPA: glycosyltransferase family 4 protein, partial [Pyrinomonadaceae bacterium]|nr:glycosyltransferase family 4 protein [Pyrinomonadaceae bacterium]